MPSVMSLFLFLILALTEALSVVPCWQELVSCWFDGSHLCFFRWNNFRHALTGYSFPLLWHLPADDGRMWLLTCKLCISMSSCQDPKFGPHGIICLPVPHASRKRGEIWRSSLSVSGPPINVCIYRPLLNKKRVKICFGYRLRALKLQLRCYFCSLQHFLPLFVPGCLDFNFLIF